MVTLAELEQLLAQVRALEALVVAYIAREKSTAEAVARGRPAPRVGTRIP